MADVKYDRTEYKGTLNVDDVMDATGGLLGNIEIDREYDVFADSTENPAKTKVEGSNLIKTIRENQKDWASVIEVIKRRAQPVGDK